MAQVRSWDVLVHRLSSRAHVRALTPWASSLVDALDDRGLFRQTSAQLSVRDAVTSSLARAEWAASHKDLPSAACSGGVLAEVLSEVAASELLGTDRASAEALDWVADLLLEYMDLHSRPLPVGWWRMWVNKHSLIGDIGLDSERVCQWWAGRSAGFERP